MVDDNSLLVGGLEHECYDFPYIGNNIPNWRTHMFQRGWTPQPDIVTIDISLAIIYWSYLNLYNHSILEFYVFYMNK